MSVKKNIIPKRVLKGSAVKSEYEERINDLDDKEIDQVANVGSLEENTETARAESQDPPTENELEHDAKDTRDEESDSEQELNPKHNFEPVGQGSSQSSRSEAGVVTLVSAGKFGFRMLFQKELLTMIDASDEIHIGVDGEKVVLCAESYPGLVQYHLKTTGNKRVVYSRSLVTDLAEKLSLDFSDTVSVTLTNFKIVEDGSCKFAMISQKTT